jgi:O-antigen/teichoic acid export membrane protein
MSLRAQVLRGGSYLILRQVLSMVITLGGVLLLLRLIGPTNYGLYAGSLGIVSFFYSVSRMGIDVYLVRREGVTDEAVYHQAFSLLLLSGSVLSVLGLLVAPLAVNWMEDPRFLAPLRVLLLFLPLMVLAVPAVARLERALDYRKVAGLELMSHLFYYALALTLAWRGFGVWAPVAGACLSYAWMVGGSYTLARYRPRLAWSPKLLREMLGYGLGYSTAGWAGTLRFLVNPLIVGHYLGPESVGYVAVAMRFVATLGFVKVIARRISIAALAKVQQDLTRLRRALEEAMGLQVLAVGPLLAGFALLAPWLLPRLLDNQWSPVLLIYPFVAARYVVGAVFNMHSSVLSVLRHNSAVMVSNLINVVVFAGTALVLVPLLGLVGYGWAEVASLGTLLVFHLYVARIFSFGYGRAWPWLVAFLPPLFFPLVGFPWGLVLWVFPLLLPLSSEVRAQVREYWAYVRKR